MRLFGFTLVRQSRLDLDAALRASLQTQVEEAITAYQFTKGERDEAYREVRRVSEALYVAQAAGYRPADPKEATLEEDYVVEYDENRRWRAGHEIRLSASVTIMAMPAQIEQMNERGRVNFRGICWSIGRAQVEREALGYDKIGGGRDMVMGRSTVRIDLEATADPSFDVPDFIKKAIAPGWIVGSDKPWTGW